MLKNLALILVTLLVAVLGLAATQPDTFHVQRETDIQAPPEKVFALLNDFQKWREWSPWEKIDPTLQRRFSGASDGVGAQYAWEGTGKAGAGRMVITDAQPPSRVAIDIEFTKPFAARNKVDFTLERRGQVIHVTWAMHGPMPYLSKLMTLFVSMDRLVGSDFEKGLAQLKVEAERP